MPDAITLLKDDHKKVKRLLKELENAEDADRRTKLLDEIEAEVTLHAQVEEEIFYPAYHAAVEEDDDVALFHEAAEEHRLVKEEFPRVRRVDAGSPEFAALAKVLKDLIEHHAEEEEAEMFPVARDEMDRAQLVELGRRIEERKSKGPAPESRRKAAASAR
jgi:hemerythrin-like domain-containing protein